MYSRAYFICTLANTRYNLGNLRNGIWWSLEDNDNSIYCEESIFSSSYRVTWWGNLSSEPTVMAIDYHNCYSIR